jgi:rhodanese-related sulfurtransferase
MFLERLPEFIGNHPLLSLAFAGIAVALLVNELTRFTRGYKAVSPAQLTLLINREDALVLDVGALNDFQKGHITGARHQPMSQLDPQAKALAAAKDKPVALVDRTGMQSAQAARKLAKAGFSRVYWLEGGLAAWQQADLPLSRK